MDGPRGPRRSTGRCIIVPNRPGLGFTISEQARAWTGDAHEVGKPRLTAKPTM